MPVYQVRNLWRDYDTGTLRLSYDQPLESNRFRSCNAPAQIAETLWSAPEHKIRILGLASNLGVRCRCGNGHWGHEDIVVLVENIPRGHTTYKLIRKVSDD